MRFSASLISIAALCSASEDQQPSYYQDDDAQGYLSQYGVTVPKAEYYSNEGAAKTEHEDGEYCPITGKLLVKGGDSHHKDGGERCPITGKLLTNLYGEAQACSEDEKDTEGKCPITGKDLNAAHDVHYSPSFTFHAQPEAYGGYSQSPAAEAYHQEPQGYGHHQAEAYAQEPQGYGGYQSPSAEAYLGGHYGHGSSYVGSHNQARGNVKSPRAMKKLAEKEKKGHKHTPGQKDHTKKRAEHTYDWRKYDPQRYEYDPYEHCVMPQNTKQCDTDEYQAMPAVCKLEMLWQNCLEDVTREMFFRGPQFQSLFDQDMNLSYDIVTDSMPTKRVKVTHPVGTVTKVELIPHPDQPYTGIFRGAKHGLMRISDTVATTPEVAKTVPGHGVKWLRDGMSSANWVAMFSFDGHKSFNFFKNRWTTVLRESNNQCARETIMKHLATVTDHVGATSVMEVAEFDEYGRKEEWPHWPYELNIEPYDVYGWTDEYQNDFQDQLTIIPMDTAMFKIFAYDEPPELGGEERLIGWIVSRSDTISSHWGDQELFFQHRRMDDDIKKRPHYFDWLQFWKQGKFSDTELLNPAPQQKCPFFFLFEKAGLV